MCLLFMSELLIYRRPILQKTNITEDQYNIEKGIGQLLLEPTFKIALKRYFGEVRFDLILYSMIGNEFKYHHSIDCRNSAEEVFDKIRIGNHVFLCMRQID